MRAEVESTIDNAEQIRDVIDNLIKAVGAKDAATAMSRYASDVVAYDLVNPLEYKGAASIGKRLDDWFSSFDGPIGIEFSDLEITAGETIAFCHGLHHVDGTKTDGTKLQMWWRTTFCLKKIDGIWTITHSHDSVPFDMETGMASLDLEP